MSAGKVYSVLMVVILTLITSAILYANQDRVAQYVYAQSPHDVVLLNGTTITTPEPFISPELQVQIWSLAPLGVILGGAFAVFLMFFKRR